MARTLQLKRVTYTGGHPSYPKAAKDLLLVVDDQAIHVRRFSELFQIPWSGVVSATVEGPEQAEKRLTATRLATIGLFAFAAKKTTSAAYLFVQTGGYDVGFEVPKTSAGTLRGQLAPWTSRLTASRHQPEWPAPG
jgi:hypothetical protein